LLRIFVTGVSGQVGGALAARLGERAYPADRSLLDLARPADIPVVLDRLSPDIIINPAAYTAVDNAEGEANLARTVNAEAPGTIARWAAGRNVPFIHLSTDYVFDGSGKRAWREDDKTGPLSVYGRTKMDGEEAVRSAHGPHLVVRTSWVYAARGKNFLRTIARLAAERQELRIVVDQCGAPTSAALIARALAQMVGEEKTTMVRRFAAAGGLVHLAASGVTSWHGFAGAIVQGLRARGIRLAVERLVPIRTEEYPTRAIRPLNSRLDLTRLANVFGVSPLKWEAALSDELDRLAKELLMNNLQGG
jgi:dTDP-4-dehydrorhamnose reductase